jgi:hypothetical protein
MRERLGGYDGIVLVLLWFVQKKSGSNPTLMFSTVGPDLEFPAERVQELQRLFSV